ncbi:uncharacterized protein MELLADRAFT_115656 [Melampsora larici-populina 98AG31]|uniref:RING-type domain-containing protein n=1 Tax=Melampsora larici-populina (strain 98AG31 / pathotype 3-4-7) TaxID=747676 RepID=F4RCL8_MELLP|nr:uncharacterized protein MELLADRAFT_115656 [Melampsora larici-populina 98AG31]EGG09756.1 hypothetical protein MELLADRAFT_115656 [Melampsora larici-populina 98AG31]
MMMKKRESIVIPKSSLMRIVTKFKISKKLTMGNNPSSHHQHSSSSRSHPHNHSNQTSIQSSSLNPFLHSSSSNQQHQQQQQSNPGPPLPPLSTTFIDGGYLLPLSNIYPASQQDWLHDTTQRLILSKKLAPFYRGLEDWESEWDTNQILLALQSANKSRQRLIQDIQKKESKEKSEQEKLTNSGTTSRRFGKTLEGPIHHSILIDSNPQFRKDVFEAVLNWEIRSEEALCYLNETAECPICFLYYPSNINLSRCCQQPICTECFVQIKRADPTAQELKSEPACCPYCVESNFGVTYEAPKRPTTTTTPQIQIKSPPSDDPLLTESSTPPTNHELSRSSSPPSTPIPSLEPNETLNPTQPSSSKRRQNTSHTSQDVVTTDSIQPDWQLKLEAVKATVARRANRRIVFRQEGDRLIPVGITSSRDPSSSFLTGIEHESGSTGTGTSGTGAGSISSRRTLASFSNLVGGHGSSGSNGGSTSSRRSRNEASFGVDLEELMIMEAMRLSLVEEEDRKKKAIEEEAKLQKISQAISEACDESNPTVHQPQDQQHQELMKNSVPFVNKSSGLTDTPSTSQLPISILDGAFSTGNRLNDEPSFGNELSSTPPSHKISTRPDTPTPQGSDSLMGPSLSEEPSTPRASYLLSRPIPLVENTNQKISHPSEPKPAEVSKPWALERSVSASSSFLVPDELDQRKVTDEGIYEDLGEYEPLVSKVSIGSEEQSATGSGSGNRNEEGVKSDGNQEEVELS